MQERQMQLFKSLLYSSTPRSIESLMEEWHVSERTIKYDISAIRKELKPLNIKLNNKKGIGYYFSPSDKPKIIEEYSLPENESEKELNQGNILLYTLFIKDQPLLIDIADYLYFDVSSIKRYIEDIAYDEQLIDININKEAHLIIEGTELNIRKLFCHLITKELKTVNGIDISLRMKKALPVYEAFIDDSWINKAEEQIKQMINQSNVWISEASLEYLTVYLYVAHMRMNRLEQFSVESEDMLAFTGEVKFAEKLLRNLNWGVTSQSEIQLLVHIMVENNIFSDSQLSEESEQKLTMAINAMLERLDQDYPNEKYDAEELINDLRPHLKQIIRKTELGGSFKQNPLFHQVKLKYSKHYRIAQTLYKVFSDYYGIEYTDNEASLIAIYLYKNMVNEEETQYFAYLVCGTGRGFSKLLETRLHNLFPNIIILERLSSLHLLKKQDISKADLIISTIDLPDKGVPVVKISSFLGRRDIQLINQVLDYGTASMDLSIIRDDSSDLLNNSFEQLFDQGKLTSLNKEHAVTFSNIILDLYSTMVNLPDSYDINQEKLLGISIHLIIALPRYFDGEALEVDAEIVEEVMQIERTHQVLAREMEAFLNRIELTIGKGIPYMERYALYQYILN